MRRTVSRGHALPGALGRLARNRPMLVTVMVLLGLGVSATAMSQLTQIRLTEAVNENWRGAYDVLVTPSRDRATSGAATTSGLIEPDFLAYGGHGGISFAQLDAIRRISGVAVAAPVTTVGYIVSDASTPHVYVSQSRLPRRPALYRVSLGVTTSDGVHQFTMQRQSAQLVLGPASPTSLKGFRPPPFLDSDGPLSWGSGGVDLGLMPLAPQVTPVVAVDPRAEEQLFGRSFSFLKALSIKPAKLHLTTFPASRIPRQFPVAAGDLGSLRDAAIRGGEIAKSAGGVYPQEPVVPIVVSDRLAYPLRLTLTVDRVGRPLPSFPQARTQPVDKALAIAAREAGPGLTRIGVVTMNVSKEFRAFEPASLTLLWPGSSKGESGGYLTQSESRLDSQLARRATYTRGQRYRQSVPAYRIRPLGLVDSEGQAPSPGEIATRSYRIFTTTPLAIESKVRRQVGDPRQAFFVAPVGTFDFGKLQLPTNPLNHVPLGAYEPASALLLPRHSGQSEVRLTPMANPLGFLTSPPEVITTISQASLLRGPKPIDAVRVRVSGLSNFDVSARDKVAEVASRIAALGLDARIVAGSSPRNVDVYVPKYLPGGKDLGWVEENWTSLGAAQAASSALSGAEKALLVLSVALALLLAVTVSSVGVEAGARDVRIWRSLGWGRRRMLWWLVSDAVVGALLVASAAVVAAALGHGEQGLVVLGLVLGTSLLGTQLAFAALLLRRQLASATAAERSRRWHRPRGGRAATRTAPLAIARRSVLRQARIGALIAGGVALSAIVVALGVAALRSAAHSAGDSLLGGYLNTELFAFHAVSLALLVVGGLVTAAIATRAWQRRRSGEVASFAALGWERERVLMQLRLERALLAATSIVFALVFAAGLHATGVGVGGLLVLPIVLILCCSYVAVAELPARRFVNGRWAT